MRALLIFCIILLTSCITTKKVGSTCKGTRMVGWLNKEDLTEMDLFNYKVAKATCPTRYNGRLPCLTAFVKRGENNYYAECGRIKE